MAQHDKVGRYGVGWGGGVNSFRNGRRVRSKLILVMGINLSSYTLFLMFNVYFFL